MPAIARDLSESRSRHPATSFCQRVGGALRNRLKSGGQLPSQQHQRISRRQQELHADINGKSKRHAPPDPQHKLDQHFRTRRENIGKDHHEGRRDTDGGAQRADR